MEPQDILSQLKNPTVQSERLLDQCRAPDLTLWREHPELYLAFVERLIEQGHPARALDLAREGERHLQNNSRLQYRLALAAARGGNAKYAEALLAPLLAKATRTDGSRPVDMTTALQVEVISLQGRVLKDRSKREPGLSGESAAWYERAAAVPGASELADFGTFPLVNAATMWRIAGNREKSELLAAEVVRRIQPHAQSPVVAESPWLAATLGEAMILLNRHEDAIGWYLKGVSVATARGDLGSLASLRNNLRRLQEVGATADADFLNEHLGDVVVFSGHMLDSPERRAAGHPVRFPNTPSIIEEVGSAIRHSLQQLNAKVGYCSLACGGDILFAEAMLDRGAELHVVLPFAEEDFWRTSVDFGRDEPQWRAWRERYQNVLHKVREASTLRVRYATTEPYLGSHELFGYTNTMLQGLAILRGRERVSEPTAVALTDRSSTALTGATADFLAAWTKLGYRIHEIDLAALRQGHPVPEAPLEAPLEPLMVGTLKRPVKAMLFADVAGYSGINERQLSEFLRAYGNYLRELFDSPIGRQAIYANTWGDGLYVVFDRVAHAAEFAIELVEPRIGQQPAWESFGLGSINPFRVGLHSGPVFELSNLFQGRPEFAGQHVNRVARIEPVTLRGCAYASEPFAAHLMMESDDRFEIEGVGVHSLAKEYDRCTLYKISRGVGAGRIEIPRSAR